MPDDNGMTYRESLEGLLKRARTPARQAELEAELALPKFPKPLSYLWQAYIRLRRRQAPAAMGGALPIGWSDLDAFERLTGASLAPWEVEAIEEIDELYLKTVNGGGNAEAST